MFCISLALFCLPHLNSSHFSSGQFTGQRDGWVYELFLNVWFHSRCFRLHTGSKHSHHFNRFGLCPPSLSGCKVTCASTLFTVSASAHSILGDLKEINTISRTPDNPLAGVKSRQAVHKTYKIPEPRPHTSLQGPQQETHHSRKLFLIVRVYHIKTVIFFPIKMTSMCLAFGEPNASSPCYSRLPLPPKFDISQVRRESSTHQRKMRLMSYLLIQNVSAKRIFHPELLTPTGREGSRGRKYLLPKTFPEFLPSP